MIQALNIDGGEIPKGTVLQSRKPSKFWCVDSIYRAVKTMPSIRYGGIKYVHGYKNKIHILYTNQFDIAASVAL